MLFTELMRAIHPHLMKDATVPVFTRNLIQMLCDIPEHEWYTKKDPSSEAVAANASLSKYYSRGLSKKLAKAILGRLTENNFIESIHHENRSDVVLNGLVGDILPFCDGSTQVSISNVGKVLFDLFCQSLEFIINPELESDRILASATQKSMTAKTKYGSGLLADCSNTCSFPGCSKHLQTLNDTGQSMSNYEVILIDSSKGISYPNIIATCHDCFQQYTLSHNKKIEKALASIKTHQNNARSTRQTLDDIAIFKGIELVIQNLSSAKPNDFEKLNYDPVTITQKLDENKYHFLVNEIKNNVVRYIPFVETTMKNLALKNQYSDDLIRAQVKESFKQLNSKKLSAEEIYQGLAERLKRITKQDIRFCYIVISYFVYSCEVFYATT